MVDSISYGNPERDIRQDETTHSDFTRRREESKNLLLNGLSVERELNITKAYPFLQAVFRRYLRPEKEYLSFSLLHNNGERSLDLICKDKVETEEGDFSGCPSSASELSDILAGRISVDHNSCLIFASSDVGSEQSNMQLRSSVGDGFRISISSTPSCSSTVSGPDDIESLGDVYVWGEVWYDEVVGADGPVSSFPSKVDMLTPKPLESNVVLDVHQIACGVRHVTLVTKQGEVFTWGEESGGRLGHGIERDFSRPRLVEFLATTNMDFVASGENHTCAVSTSGDLFTWGDGMHSAGLLGHGTDASHWIPKRVSGPLEGLQVLSIACGTWHSALVTSNGKLFTFGDGTFGVLGHGNRETFLYPKEVQSLNGLKTIKVACGLWHTAAIIEVMGQYISSKKLFTWGDGDKYRLGHGNKDTYLLPTCVSSLIEYNFDQLACGHTMTIALTTSGHVFTMGSTEHGQLGNPTSDGKSARLVQDKLVGEFVQEISCGAYHVAILTSRTEVFTWGKGANGRLGHGDTEDRKTPTLVEALKDRRVKNISCGSNFTSSICIHKWVSGTDQSNCYGCRQPFGFARKRHNCYNCGLVHCNACSSKKAWRAVLAPTPGKPHRVCDACYTILKAAEAGNPSNISRKVTAMRSSVENRERIGRGERRYSRLLLSPTIEPTKYFEIKPGRSVMVKSDDPSSISASQVRSLQQLKDIAFPSSLIALQNPFKPLSACHSPINSRSSSAYSRRPSPPRTATLGFSRSVIESLNKSNELLSQEVTTLQNQIKSFKQKYDKQDIEILKLRKNAQESAVYAARESSICRVAKEVVKSITHQLKGMTEKLPLEASESETIKSLHAQAEAFLSSNETSEMLYRRTEMNVAATEAVQSNNDGNSATTAGVPEQTPQNESRSPETSGNRNGTEKEITEQFEPGIYITYILHGSGGKIFRRVRFSKRRFDAQQAEEWWARNKERVFRRYSPHRNPVAPTGLSSIPPSADSDA